MRVDLIAWISRGAVAVAMAALAGCATTAGSYSFESGTDEGLVVLSARVKDQCGGSMVTTSIGYEGLLIDGDLVKGIFLFSNPLVKTEFVDPPGYFHVRPLKAGQYRFTTFNRTSTAGGFSSAELDTRFTVEPGKVHYLGELSASLVGCQMVRFKTSDERQRDAALFDQKMETLKSTAFDHQILVFPDRADSTRVSGR